MFCQPMPRFEPRPLIEPVAGEGDCEHCGRFRTEQCAYREPVFQEACA